MSACVLPPPQEDSSTPRSVTKETKLHANEGQRQSVGVSLRSLVADRNTRALKSLQGKIR